jgi:hypothetical protein
VRSETPPSKADTICQGGTCSAEGLAMSQMPLESDTCIAFISWTFEATGATLLFLSPYSPDFNQIEHDFAALKKRREYQETVPLDDIVKGYQ